MSIYRDVLGMWAWLCNECDGERWCYETQDEAEDDLDVHCLAVHDAGRTTTDS